MTLLPMCGEVQMFSALPECPLSFHTSHNCICCHVSARCRHENGQCSVMQDITWPYTVLELGHFTQYITHTLNVSKCAAGEDQLDWSCEKWRSITDSQKKGTEYIQENEEKLTGLVTSWGETAF